MKVVTGKVKHFLIEAKKVIIKTIKEEEALELMKLQGYTLDELKRGRRLCYKAYTSYKEQRELGNEIDRKSLRFRQLQDTARNEYFKIFKLACETFRDDPITTMQLGLTWNPLKANQSWLKQATELYDNILKDRKATKQLEKQGISRATILSGSSLIDQLNRLSAIDEKRESGRQSLRNLASWYAPFLKALRLICKQRPEMRDRLGL